jgi:Predicted cobalamin binding protein
MKALTDELIKNIGELDEDAALLTARTLVDSGFPAHRLMRHCLEGLRIVGRKYEEGDYYASGLIMAGEIMRQILEMTSFRPAESAGAAAGGLARTVVLGTIVGDIHDLGKNLVGEVLKGHGFRVHDLGVDVPPEVFLSEAIRCQPDIVGISILISSCYPKLMKAVELVRTMMPEGYKQPGLLIGGGAVNEQVQAKCQADIWCQDILKLGEVCRAWLDNGRPNPVCRHYVI